MQFLPALLLSAAYNLDNIVIGLAYSVKGIRVSVKSNLLIAVITSSGTLISMLPGAYIIKFIPFHSYIGAAALGIIGLYMTVKSVLNLVREHKECLPGLKSIDEMIDYAGKSDKDHSKDIDLKEAAFVACGLSINNMGAGIAASAAGINAAAAVISTFFLSALFLWGGIRLGLGKLSGFFGKFAPLISGAIIIALSIVQICVQ